MTTAAPAHIAGLGVSRSAEKRVGRWPSEMPRRNEAQGRPRDVDEMHGPGMSDCQRPDERPRCNGLHTCSGVPRAVFIPHRHPTLDGATSPSFVGSIACTVSWQVLIGDPPPYNQPLSMAPAGGQRPDGSPMTMLSYAPGALASPHSVQFPGVENSEPSPVQDASWESTGVPAVLPWTGRLCNVDSKTPAVNLHASPCCRTHYLCTSSPEAVGGPRTHRHYSTWDEPLWCFSGNQGLLPQRW